MEHKILLVDGNALVHRAFHAIPPLTAPSGEIVNAVYGFFSIFLAAISEIKPHYGAVAFDERGKTFRDDLYAEYKAKRVKAPQALYDQIPIIKNLLHYFEIPIYAVRGFEADDVIGTMSRQVQKSKIKNQNDNSKLKIIILTGDKDTYQLIDDNTSVFTARKGLNDTSLIDKKTFTAQYGFDPKYMVDFKALRGDPSDNIPGVAGIGEVTAKKLIAEFNTLDNVYANLSNINPTVAGKLTAHEKEARLSRQLSQIVCDIPLEVDLDKFVIHNFDQPKIEKELLKLGFKSLVKRLPDSHRKVANHIQEKLL